MSTIENTHSKRPAIPHAIRLLAVPIILLWVLVAVAVNAFAPQLEVVGEQHSAPMTPGEAPSLKAMMRMGKNFGEFDSNNTAMIVIEGQEPLGEAAHRYYADVVRQLSRDPKHVQHIQDFWGDSLTAAGVQSTDGKGAYVFLNLAGNQGEPLANESANAVRDVIERTPAPHGVKAYVIGPAALNDDDQTVGDSSLLKITVITLLAIALMLFLVYRSVVTTLIQLFLVGIELGSARGVVAVLGTHGMGLTTFAANILTMLSIAAGTDYGIFLVGRYLEARQAGEDLETAYYTTFRGVAPVILGSGLTIAGAMYCLRFTHLPYFNTMAAPVAIGMLIAVAAGLTLGPAVVTVASRFRLLEPKRVTKRRLWRRVGTAVVRWPAPIFAASAAVVLVGMIGLPGYKTSYNDRLYLPAKAPSNIGYAAALKHFTDGRLDPDILMVEANRDMRNPADMLVLDRVAKNILRVDGIAMVQGITRPLGIPIQHSSLPFMDSMQSQTIMQNLPFLEERVADMLKMSGEMDKSIDLTQRMYDITRQLDQVTHHITVDTHETVTITDELRNHIADFDDVWRPVRSYFYWDKHCFDIPVCWSVKSLYDSLDGVDQLAEKLHVLATDLDKIDVLMPQMLALFPPMIDTLKTTRSLTLTMYSTFSAMLKQMKALTDTAVVMGQSFDAARSDDFFYLPPEAFDNADFKRGLKDFLSPDGKSARFFITHEGDPATPEETARVAAERTAARNALKLSSLADAKVYLGGTAPTYKDMQYGAKYDLMIAALSAFTLIFIIMVLLTRSLVAALVIVGTAAASIASAFGLSVLIWQDLLGIRMHWVVLAFAVIVLLAVGSDYNLLLVSRFKEEIGAGFRTAIIRSMAGTGGVVTAAGLVFAFTMGSMLGSDLRVIGQFGSTVCVGLLLDTLIVRSLLMPSAATLLGRWFWWPQVPPRRAA